MNRVVLGRKALKTRKTKAFIAHSQCVHEADSKSKAQRDTYEAGPEYGDLGEPLHRKRLSPNEAHTVITYKTRLISLVLNYKGSSECHWNMRHDLELMDELVAWINDDRIYAVSLNPQPQQRCS